MSRSPFVCSFALAALAVTAGHAHAQSGAVFGGVDVGRDQSAYVGAFVPFSQTDGRWAVRAVAATGQYDYESGPFEIEGEYQQADVSLVRTYSGPWGYLNLGAGPRVTRTQLSPADPGNDREGTRWDALITVDGVRRLEGSGWEIGGYGALGVDGADYFVRVDATRSVSPRLRLGGELVAQGDPSYDRQGAAVVAVFAASDAVSVRASVGVRGGEGHVGLGLVRAF